MLGMPARRLCAKYKWVNRSPIVCSAMQSELTPTALLLAFISTWKGNECVYKQIILENWAFLLTLMELKSNRCNFCILFTKYVK